MNKIISILFLLIFLPGFSFLFHKELSEIIAWQATDSLFILPAATTDDLLTASKLPISSYIDDLQTLAINKIGPILDSYTSSLPSKIIQIFGNLTYEEFDALKMIAARESVLKQFLCDSNPKFPLPFRAVQKRMELNNKTPILTEKVYTLYNKFTPEIIEAVKAMLKVHPHLRWSFCSSIFAISSSKELTNVNSPAVIQLTVDNCKIMADNKSIYYSAICDKPDDFIQKYGHVLFFSHL